MSFEYRHNQRKYMDNFRKSNLELYFSSQYNQTAKNFDQWIDYMFPTISTENRDKLKKSIWTCQINSFIFLTTPSMGKYPNRLVATDLKFANLIPKLWNLQLETLSWEYFDNQNAICFSIYTFDGYPTIQKLYNYFGTRLANLSHYENGAAYWYFDDNDLKEISVILNIQITPKLPAETIIYNRFDLPVLK